MRELHVVALSEDGRHVLLATGKGATRGGFRVALDARLMAAVRGELPRPGEEEVRPAELTPRDIQARLRAGESAEEIAAEAGVPVSRVERYAGPVLSEREKVIGGARTGFVSRARLGVSAVPLGEAVDHHLSLTPSLRPESVVWTARRQEEGDWLVELRYTARARQRYAAWRYDLISRQVTAVDAGSAALAYVEPAEEPSRGRRSRVSGAQPGTTVAAKPAEPRGAATKRTPAKRTPAKRPAAKREPAPERVPAPLVGGRAAGRVAPAPQSPAASTGRRSGTKATPAAASTTRVAAPATGARSGGGTVVAPGGRAAASTSAPAAKAPAAKTASKAAAKKSTAEKTAGKKSPAEKTTAKTTAAKKSATETTPAAQSADTAVDVPAVDVAAPSAPPTLRVVPPPAEPDEPAEADPAAQATEPDDAPEPSAPAVEPRPTARPAGPRGRASVPAWADVLLGTSPARRTGTEEPGD